MKRDYSLDYLKAFAIAGVCQVHYMHFANTLEGNFIAMLSAISVPLFFMVNVAINAFYQGIPMSEYTKMAENIQEGIEDCIGEA